MQIEELRAEMDRGRADVPIAMKPALLSALLDVAEAVARHRTDVWGDDGPVTHEHDAALYASLTRLEEC